jgi:hypothetical protein
MGRHTWSRVSALAQEPQQPGCIHTPAVEHVVSDRCCAEPFGGGLVNAQLSVLKGLEAAKRQDYIYVVPPLVQM